MAQFEKKTADEIKAILDHEIAHAQDYDSSEIAERRTRAIEYYFGEMNDTPPIPNRSSVTSRDTSDVIGWILPDIMRTFLASGRMVDYEPENEEDEEMADQASEYIMYEFLRENDGYRIVYNATHDSLLQGNGIIKQWWDKNPVTEISEHTGLDEMALARLVTPEYVKVLAQDQREEEIEDPYTGEYTKATVYDVKIECTKANGALRYDVLEPEDFLIDKSAVTIDDARFVAHRDEKTKSQLIGMGFDPKIVANLPSDALRDLEEQTQAREEDRVETDDAADDANTIIEVHECYCKIDVDGDGVAELVRAYYAGRQGSGELLEWEVWEDENPFDDIPCEPVPHRFEARSIFDSTYDMQRVKTVVMRQMLDNLYAVNMPQRLVHHGAVLNPDSLVNPKFGQPVFTKNNMQYPAVQPLEVPYIGDKAMAGLEYVDRVIERRTGVSQASAALDPEKLQNQSATEANIVNDARRGKVELIARNMAEGWRKVFRKSLKLIVKHQDRPKTIRLRGEWVPMDPRQWNANMDACINVGLGTGSRDRDILFLNQVLGHQVMAADRFMQAGFAPGAIKYLGKIRDVMVKIGESAGLRNADDMHPEFTPETEQQLMQIASQPQEDPKIQIEREKAQIDAQAKQEDIKLDREKAGQEVILNREKQQGEAVLNRDKMESDIVLKREQIAAEIELKREQLAAELQLKRYQLEQELKIKRELGLDRNATDGAAKVASSQVRPGGEPG